jgi:hypothetical protein
VPVSEGFGADRVVVRDGAVVWANGLCGGIIVCGDPSVDMEGDVRIFQIGWKTLQTREKPIAMIKIRKENTDRGNGVANAVGNA